MRGDGGGTDLRGRRRPAHLDAAYGSVVDRPSTTLMGRLATGKREGRDDRERRPSPHAGGLGNDDPGAGPVGANAFARAATGSV